jgi:hypothetical protein
MGAVVKRALAAVPVDARPAVRSQVQDLVACAGWDLRVPPVSLLGHFRRPGDRDALRDWLWEQAPQVDGFVLSLDMLVYGGLVPSRFIEEAPQALQARLAPLHDLKRLWPDKPIFAFAASMRISNNNVAEEEKAYWSDFGSKLWAWSFHTDRALNMGLPEEAARSQEEVRRLEHEIPQAIRADYAATRQRNLQITLLALKAVKDGVITRLVLPQDDTAEFGLNVAERRELQRQVQTLGIESRVALYAGADEVMHTLSARLVTTLEQGSALGVAVCPSDPVGLQHIHARYEDRPLSESIASQMDAVGARLVHTVDDADVVLAVHTQGTEQGDWAMGIDLPTRSATPSDWLDTLRRIRKQGQPLALADMTYANGGDPWLFKQGIPLPDAYAGWNTASNTLGSVLAQCVLGRGRLQQAPSRRALSLRLLEDLLYQAEIRQVLRSRVDETRCTSSELQQAAKGLMLPASHAFAQAHGLSHRVVDLSLPWGRSFEVDLQLEPCP